MQGIEKDKKDIETLRAEKEGLLRKLKELENLEKVPFEIFNNRK